MKRDYLGLVRIFNAAADAMCVIDVNFRILRANDVFLTLVGRTGEEAVGRKCQDVFPGPECCSARSMNC
jgi:PAS domain S-box-containing protein